ncbi:MAG: hypothetical protein JWP48_6142 [Actinoallomurus sp.]|nr:hypothetical protein [Actinoallomurus sp.]
MTSIQLSQASEIAGVVGISGDEACALSGTEKVGLVADAG